MNFSFHLLILTNPCLRWARLSCPLVIEPIVGIGNSVLLIGSEGVLGEQVVPLHCRSGTIGVVVTVVPDILPIVGVVVEDHLGICIPVEDLHQLDIVESRPSVPPRCACPQLPGECMHGSSGLSSIQLGGTIPVESSAEFENIQSIHTTKFRFRHYQLL